MKKSLLTFATLVACMCLTTSCGDDKGKVDPDTPEKVTYIEPCLNWTLDKIGIQKNSLYSDGKWKLSPEAQSKELIYLYSGETMGHYYKFDEDNKLVRAEAQFLFYDEGLLNQIIDNIQTKYDVKLVEGVQQGDFSYTATTTINQHITNIIVVNHQFTYMLVMFESVIDLTKAVDDPAYLQGKWTADSYIENGKKTLYDSTMEFNGTKVVANIGAGKPEEYDFKYETGKLTLSAPFYRDAEYKINFFTVDAIQLERTDTFGNTIIVTFFKEK